MIEIDKKIIKIYGNDEVLILLLNSKLTLKERINALKVKSIEECKQLVLEELWKMHLKEFSLNIWSEIQPYIGSSKNFMFIYEKGNIKYLKETFTFSVSKIYLNKIK